MNGYRDLSIADRGLALFNAGMLAQAIPFLERAAREHDARAQYVLATALFNGDHVGRDVVRSFELMRRASAGGLVQAAESLKRMTKMAADVSPPSDPPFVSEGLLSAETLAVCQRLLAPLHPDPRPPAAGSLVQVAAALTADLLRERLGDLLPHAIADAVRRSSRAA